MKRAIFKLEGYYSECTNGEKELVKYLLNNPRKAIEKDIHSLAKTCFCSGATVVRVAKKIGFKGYKELKTAIYNDIIIDENLLKDNNSSKEKPSTQEQISKDLCDNHIKSIENVLNLLDFSVVEAVVKLLIDCKHVNLFGIGASYLVAKDMQMKLERINKNTSLYEDIHMQIIRSNNIEKNDISIIVSYSGQTNEILKIANNIKEKGGIIISILKYGSTKLNQMTDYPLYLPSVESDIRISASSSRISQLTIIDILFNSYYSRLENSKIDQIIHTKELLEKDKSESYS